MNQYSCKNLSPLIFPPGETALLGALLFLGRGRFGGCCLLLFLVCAAGLGLLLCGLLLVGFRGFVAHGLVFFGVCLSFGISFSPKV